MDKHNINSMTNYRQALEENTLMQTSKQTNKQIIIITTTTRRTQYPRESKRTDRRNSRKN
jgi:hypothetical protein